MLRWPRESHAQQSLLQAPTIHRGVQSGLYRNMLQVALQSFLISKRLYAEKLQAL
jgi:hypothetical protein